MSVQAALLVIAFLAPAHQSAALRPADPATQALVKQVLEDRWNARDIPDIGLLGNTRRLLVRAELPASKLLLNAGALPAIAGYEFRLISAADAASQAERTQVDVPLVAIDRLITQADSTTLWIGVDLVVPAKPGTITLCCCERRIEYRRALERWVFVRWLETECR